MQLTVQGKQLDVGNALRSHVEQKLEDLNEKYFNHATFANVTFAREGHGHGMFRAHIQIRIGKDIHVRADATEGDPYAAFDTAASKVTRQMGRYKERLRDHRERLEKLPEGATTPARDYTLSANEDSGEDGEGAAAAHANDPVIIAELATGIQAMSVSDAVMRMDLSGAPAMLFRNPKNDAINLVYRRADGNIGWVDTEAGRRKSAGKPAKKAKAAKPAAKPAAKKAAKKPAAKKGAAKKSAARGTAKSRAPGNIKKLAAARKAGVKKAATKKTAAKKTGAKKAAAKKSAARKNAAGKSTARRPAAKRAKSGRR